MPGPHGPLNPDDASAGAYRKAWLLATYLNNRMHDTIPHWPA